ncbi:hypothetical protein LYSHEL_21680 [Lysobacter helvus]|uniref:DUF2867 domain-containing protein n=3 Tax=Lysobacterales TaxID=135614 RepID=A0ABN6FUU0_9GAMM|nr:hypothetical protein LYSCAS_21690 [Lysobacter caseinilyticus]BCT96297.1 hypothetical protein LYSHEL_21680 [Lysobacter helvus]
MHDANRISPVDIPTESQIRGFYKSVDLADAYAITLPDHASRNPEVLARLLFAQPPPSMQWLLRLRDVLVRPFGIKTATHLQASSTSKPDQRIGVFRIYYSRSSEIILGEDDKHLDFRLSVLCRPVDGPAEDAHQVVVSTVVTCHNTLGHSYIALIAPFHRIVVRASMRRAARRGWSAPSSRAP